MAGQETSTGQVAGTRAMGPSFFSLAGFRIDFIIFRSVVPLNGISQLIS
jgi:hypothetical protein